MTNMLYDAPYHIEGRDASVQRLKHFYFVIPSFLSDAETVDEERETFLQLQESLPQWAVIHIYTREALYGANQPEFPEEYVVAYFTLDVDGNRVPVTTGLSAFTFSDVTYAMVSA